MMFSDLSENLQTVRAGEEPYALLSLEEDVPEDEPVFWVLFVDDFGVRQLGAVPSIFLLVLNE